MAEHRIDLKHTLLSNCNQTTGWADDGAGNISQIATTTTAPQEGTTRLEYGCAAAIGVFKFTFQGGVTIDVTQNEIGIWFLLPKGNQAGNSPVLRGGTGNALRLRLYTGANYADYYIGDDDTLPGGWQWIRCSGDDPDATTATPPTYTAIDAVGIYTDTQNANDNSKGDAFYGVDMLIAYNRIDIIGYNQAVSAASPDEAWTPDSIYALCVETKNDTNNLKRPNDFYWGMIEKENIFYRYFSSLQFGDGGETGAFTAENSYLYFKPVSGDVLYNLVAKNNNVTTFGKKDVGVDKTYARDGCQIVNETQGNRRGDIVAESGAELNFYASRVEKWNRINLGSGGTGTIDVIKTDFYDNGRLELRSTNLSMENVRMFLPSGGDVAIGTVFSIPDNMTKIQIFLNTDSLRFRVNTKIEEYIAGDNTNYDLVVDEGITVQLVNSVFDENKLKRIG